MAARAAVRDAGRVLDVPYGTVDRIAKLIPEGPKVYLDDCLKSGSDLQKACETDEVAREASWSSLAHSRVSCARTRSTPRELSSAIDHWSSTSRSSRKGLEQEVVTQFAMNDVEALGLLKMDFLGLRNLDVIRRGGRARERAGRRERRRRTG